jgi:hypothetical protein
MLTYRTEAREVSLAARHWSWIALVWLKISEKDLTLNGLTTGLSARPTESVQMWHRPGRWNWTNLFP